MPALEVAADGVDHALGRSLTEHVGCGVGIHKDIHKRLQGLDLAARLGNTQIDDDLRRHGGTAIALNVTGAEGLITAI